MYNDVVLYIMNKIHIIENFNDSREDTTTIIMVAQHKSNIMRRLLLWFNMLQHHIQPLP